MMCKEVSSFQRDSQFCIKCADVVKSAEEANKEKQAAAKEEEEESVTSSEDSEESKEDADKKSGVWVSVQISLRSLLSNRCYLIVVI